MLRTVIVDVSGIVNIINIADIVDIIMDIADIADIMNIVDIAVETGRRVQGVTKMSHDKA